MTSFTFRTLLILLSCFYILQACQPNGTDTSASTNQPLFEMHMATKTGLQFNIGGQYMLPGDPTGLYSNISAVAAGDLNNDGLPDLVFSGGHENTGVFLNKGDLTFENITRSAGVIDFGEKHFDTEGINLVDINGDGWLDIYILKTGLTGNFSTGTFNKDGANLLFINQQDNTFKEEAAKYGLDIIGLSHTANFFDYDGDDDLDVYIAQTAENGASFSFPYYQKTPRSKWLNDQFLENEEGTYVDVREKVGLPMERNIALSVSVGDINNDGFGDIYVANDFFGRDFFFLNNGNKTFSDAHADYFTKTAMSAMGSDLNDINNDGYLDLFVGEMMPPGHVRQKQNLVPFSLEIYNRLEREKKPQYTRNMLQLNNGGKGFSEIGCLADVYATEWSWSSIFFDADLDGYKDLFVANGILRDMTNMDFVKNNFGDDYTLMADPESKAKARNQEAPVVKTSNFIYKNEDGLHFQDMTGEWDMKEAHQTRGATYADLDGDGDLDLILNNMDDGPVIYENKAIQQGRGQFLKIKLNGPGQNKFGIGATVNIKIQDNQQSQFISTQRGFQSCPEPVAHFGIGSAQTIDEVEVIWPGGKKESWKQLEAGKTHTLNYGEGNQLDNGIAAGENQLITATAYIHKHTENEESEFKSDRIALQKISLEGPGISILNGEEPSYILTGASGYPTIVKSNSGIQEIGSGKESEDLFALPIDINNDGLEDIYLCRGSDGVSDHTGVDEVWLQDATGQFKHSPETIENENFSGRFATAWDFDADGDMDLFVAGRQQSHSDPLCLNRLLVNNDGSLKDATEQLLPDHLRTMPITSAVWSDVNNDGRRDLVTVGRWHSVLVHVNQPDKFESIALPASSGWWNSIFSADVDNDGDMDLITGNHGLNTTFKASPDKPVTLVLHDFDSNSTTDPMVFKYTGDVNAPYVNRDLLTSQMPALNRKYYNFAEYSKATYDNMVPEDVKSSDMCFRVVELRSGIWLNEGNLKFKFTPLPHEGQFAPVHGILAEDLTGDGHIDLLLAGNSNSNHFELGSIDALGCVLMSGDGNGQYAIADLQLEHDKHAFYRGMALTIRDGLPTIAIAQNNGPISAYALDSEVAICPNDRSSAKIKLKSGKTRKWEKHIGYGYLSHSLPLIFKNSAVAEIQFE